MEVTKRNSDSYPRRHSRGVTQTVVHAICAVSNMESYWLFSLQNCVGTSLCGHSRATISLLMVLGAVPVSHSNGTCCCSVSPVVGDSAVWWVQMEGLCHVHWPVWFAPVCVVGVFGGCLRRLALSGRPGVRAVCVSLFHVKNPVQWTRNYQRRRSLSGAIAVQTFTKVTKGSNWAGFAPKGKMTCGKPLLVFPSWSCLPPDSPVGVIV